jgi:hypothetical protein
MNTADESSSIPWILSWTDLSSNNFTTSAMEELRVLLYVVCLSKEEISLCSSSDSLLA